MGPVEELFSRGPNADYGKVDRKTAATALDVLEEASGGGTLLFTAEVIERAQEIARSRRL